jgi:hypothetical protein
MDYRRKEWAAEPSQVTIWHKEDLEVNEAFIGISGSPTTVPGLKQAPSRDRRREFLIGNTIAINAQLLEIIKAQT